MKTAADSGHYRSSLILTAVWLLGCASQAGVAARTARWSEPQANAWYAAQPWLVGNNYVPRSAINQLEMWQAETFDSVQIDQELAWAESLGMNTMRVFLHDLLWQQDSAGFRKRIDNFLGIAARRHIRPMLVFFDSVWDPSPHLGRQHPPVPGVHNSGWVQSPGARALADTGQYARLEAYVQGVLRAFGNDARVLAWDLWNEPGAENTDTYGKQEIPDKVARVTALLPRVFEWAHAVHPTQPLTSGICCVESNPGHLSKLQEIQLGESDVLTFHNYGARSRSGGRCGGSSSTTGRSSVPSTWPVRWEHLRGHPADREGRAGGDDQLGIGGREDPDLAALGLPAAPVCKQAAGRLAPRGAPSGRHAVPPGRSGVDPAADGGGTDAGARKLMLRS